MLDNGAFSKFTKGTKTNWDRYYAWCERWMIHPNTWAVIPDEIDAGSQYQDALLRDWPFGERGSPVWHMDEPISRLLHLIEKWPRVCVGSTGEFWKILSDDWRARMDETWNEIVRETNAIPNLHMLRGLAVCKYDWPFSSADSTDIAKNHHRPGKVPLLMADRWDAMGCPVSWEPQEVPGQKRPALYH